MTEEEYLEERQKKDVSQRDVRLQDAIEILDRKEQEGEELSFGMVLTALQVVYDNAVSHFDTYDGRSYDGIRITTSPAHYDDSEAINLNFFRWETREECKKRLDKNARTAERRREAQAKVKARVEADEIKEMCRLMKKYKGRMPE